MTPEAENTAPPAKRVSVVIVSFNRADAQRRSLAALGNAHQILVVDNGSVDESPDLDTEFPDVRFIRLPKDFGLTRALNVGIRAADGEYILLLHDDTWIAESDVAKLADFLESRADVAAVCPLLTAASGEPAPQMRALPTPAQPDPPFRAAPAGNEPEVTAECVSGAAILFRTFFLRAMRQIDEHYGNYGSDIELCAQVRRSSRKLVMLREVAAVHDWLESPASKGALAGDRTAGTAVFLGKYHGFAAGLLYRVKSAVGGLATFRFKVVEGALSGAKIDGGN